MARAKRNGSARGRALAAGRQPASPAAVAALDAATRRILALKAQIGRNFYDMGKELARVRDREMYALPGLPERDERLGVRAPEYDPRPALLLLGVVGVQAPHEAPWRERLTHGAGLRRFM